MGRMSVLGTLACGLAAAAMMPNTAQAQDRVSASEKGSVLIFSKVEIRWDEAGNLLQDTFICLTNDFPDDVTVQMYFINGDPELDAVFGPFGDLIERAHPGWNWVDNRVELTGDQPIYWSAASGAPAGVSPFASALDPGFPPGRPCPDGSGERCMRGYIVAWAEDGESNTICWDHLSGTGTLVNYDQNYAWEYAAWAFQCPGDETPGDPTATSTDGEIMFDGVEYDYGFQFLLLQFQAAGSAAFSGPNAVITSDTDITLHPIKADLRQETDGPVTTKASYEVWNSNEVKFSGLDRCITCWDQTLASQYTDNGPANHLILQNLLTDHGKARIQGLKSQLCDVDFDPDNNADFPFPPGDQDPVDDRDIVSEAASLLGLKATILTFNGGNDGNGNNAAAGVNLVGLGIFNDTVANFTPQYIKADAVAAPPSDENTRTPVNTPSKGAQFESLIDTFLTASR